MNILISDKLSDKGIDILRAVPGFKVDCQFGLAPEELKSVIKDYHGLIIRGGTKVTEDIIDCAHRLKVIGRAGVGLDNVDVQAAAKKGIVVMNTPSGNTIATAEHTIGMILALARHIPQAHTLLKSGIWNRSKFKGVELYGKKLGVIGLGRIGTMVAKLAKAFGMDILAYDPFVSTDIISQKGATPVELEELLRQSDFITIHIPKTDQTQNFLSDKEFGLMKKTVRVIHCARGGIIDERALVAALKEGVIAGCALDVYEQEPLAPDSPLLKFDNCVVTPHLGAATFEAKVNVAIEIAEAVRDVLIVKHS